MEEFLGGFKCAKIKFINITQMYENLNENKTIWCNSEKTTLNFLSILRTLKKLNIHHVKVGNE